MVGFGVGEGLPCPLRFGAQGLGFTVRRRKFDKDSLVLGVKGCDVRPDRVQVSGSLNLISQKVLIKLFCKSRFPHKSVNLSFLVTNIKNKLTDL